VAPLELCNIPKQQYKNCIVLFKIFVWQHVSTEPKHWQVYSFRFKTILFSSSIEDYELLNEEKCLFCFYKNPFFAHYKGQQIVKNIF